MFDEKTRTAITNSPFVAVTICDHTDYELRCVNQLRSALTRHGIVFLAANLESDASWRADASTRSAYIHKVWCEAGKPVLWLDPDTDPNIDFGLIDELRRADFAVHDESRRHGRSPSVTPEFTGRFIWFGQDASAGELLACWSKRCGEQPTGSDMVHLGDAWAQLPTHIELQSRWLPARAAGIAGSDASRGAGLPHSRSLFAPATHPYCIYAPAYTEASAGVWSLHALCHSLNLAGYPAYLLLATPANPRWITPLMTPETLTRYVDLGLAPIVVYPEIVTGNPANGRTVVRYILNRPGHLTGAGMDEDPDDLLFYYSEEFIDGDRGDKDVLTAPTINTALFRPDPGRVREKTIVFQYRYPLDKIDLSLFPPGTELLTMADPLPLPELARLFQGAKTLYSYELSTTCTLAMAAGCPVIYRTEGGLTEPPGSFLFGTNGAAMHEEPGGLERAIRTLPAAQRAIAGMEDTFWEHLEVFVRKTQAAARRRA